MGEPVVVDIIAAEGSSDSALLGVAGAVEKHSEHPLAQAILKRAEGLIGQPATAFTNIDGQGAQAMIGDQRILLGNRKLMDAQKVDLNGLEEQAARLQGEGVLSCTWPKEIG